MNASPLLCDPQEKSELEARNTVEQLAYITDLVTSKGVTKIRESHVLELQRIAIDGIYPCGGRYRDARYELQISDSAHHPPPASSVRGLIADFVDALNDPAVRLNVRMAYALWHFNWIHPFPGGNGRTARALSYLVLCTTMRVMPPGEVTIPMLIARDRDGYLRALRQVDALYAAAGDDERPLVRRTDVLAPMTTYLDEKIETQLLGGLTETVDQLPPGGRFIARLAVAAFKAYLRSR